MQLRGISMPPSDKPDEAGNLDFKRAALLHALTNR